MSRYNDRFDEELNRLRDENLSLQKQNIEYRRNIELMRDSMDIQRAKIITDILNWVDNNGNRQTIRDSFRSIYGCLAQQPMTSTQIGSQDIDDVQPLLRDQREQGNECNNSSNDHNISAGIPLSKDDISYKPIYSKSETPFKVTSHNHTQMSQSEQNAYLCENVTSSSRRQMPSPRKHPKPGSPRHVWPTRTFDSPVHNEINPAPLAPPMLVKEHITSEDIGLTSKSKILFDTNLNPIDVESGLSLKERRIIDRPIDSILGKPAMTLYQTYAYANTLEPKHRLIGEIAFQLERRILDYIFGEKRTGAIGETKKRRFYGYTLKNIETKIEDEARGDNCDKDSIAEASMKHSLRYITRILMPLNYDLEFHGDFAEKMVNHYGLLNTSPDKSTIKNFGLEDPRVLRVLLAKLVQDETVLKHMLVLLDSLCLMAHHDKRPLFLW